MPELLDRYSQILSQMHAACGRAGRAPEEVTLIAVSKMKPEEDIRLLLSAGALHFGENKVQDLCRKMQDIPQEAGNKPIWHMIGSLQTNKVKYLVGSPVSLIHSVDSVKLASALQKEAEKKQISSHVRILLEINIGGEATKGGFAPEEAEEALRTIAQMDRLKVCGLMTVCPPGDEEANRPYFRSMRLLRDRLSALGLPGVELKELSMGMSHDFQTAIEEGATLVRVGSSLFGERDYSAPEWTPQIQDEKDASKN